MTDYNDEKERQTEEGTEKRGYQTETDIDRESEDNLSFNDETDDSDSEGNGDS